MTKPQRNRWAEAAWKLLIGVGTAITVTILISGGQEYGDMKNVTREYPAMKQDVSNIKSWMHKKDSEETVRYIIDTMRTGRMQQSIIDMRQEFREMRQELKLTNKTR